jgi:hypothetical protein
MASSIYYDMNRVSGTGKVQVAGFDQESYWRGRKPADSNVALPGKSQIGGPEESYRRMIQYVTEREKKIEAAPL